MRVPQSPLAFMGMKEGLSIHRNTQAAGDLHHFSLSFSQYTSALKPTSVDQTISILDNGILK
jgi:hypothetical protein